MVSQCWKNHRAKPRKAPRWRGLRVLGTWRAEQTTLVTGLRMPAAGTRTARPAANHRAAAVAKTVKACFSNSRAADGERRIIANASASGLVELATSAIG